jgi:hypothetical protein
MKKLFIILVAVLLVGSVTVAQAYFGIADPKTTEGAANVKIPVYNNSGSALDEGDVVIWQVGSSTGDNDLYVTTTSTANTGLVAGVVAQGGIASASSGVIIVYGLAQCDVLAAPAGTILCASGTAGAGYGCGELADEAQAYAVANEVGNGTQVECFVF